MRRTLLATVVGFTVVVAAACGSDSSSGGNAKKAFAACATVASECASGVWDRDHRACSVSCKEDEDCPAEPKSGEPKCEDDVCQAERKDIDCEHPDGTGGKSGTGGTSSTGGASSGGAGSGGEATGGTSASGGSSATGGTSATGGKTGGAVGVGDPCRTTEECESGICYMPGGAPGFCTAECSQSFDFTCRGKGPDGQNSAHENVYCMAFADGGRCYPGCVSDHDVCSKYSTVCVLSVKDIAGYNGNVCQERL